MTPDEYLGNCCKLCQEKRGVQDTLTYVGNRAMLVYRLPLNEVVFDFYDRLKSSSKGYASFDYELDGYTEGDLVKMNILVNGEPVDALAMIVHRSQRRTSRPQAVRALKGTDPAPDVQDRHSGRHRRENHRPRGYLGAAERRAGEMLRRRHHAQTQTAREAEKRQKAKMRQYAARCVSAWKSRSGALSRNALKMGDEKLRALTACILAPVLIMTILAAPLIIITGSSFLEPLYILSIYFALLCTLTYGLFFSTIMETFPAFANEYNYLLGALIFSIFMPSVAFISSADLNIGAIISLFLILWFFSSIHAYVVWWISDKMHKHDFLS
jgi:hypothetical protein